MQGWPSSPSGLDETSVEKLLRAAREATGRAHAPYSGFRVGAAVLDEAGRIFAGCNVENASYGLTICAERNAAAAAVAGGAGRLRAVAIYTPTDRPTPPCGACRQVLAEFAAAGMEVHLVDDGGHHLVARLADLLPAGFGPDQLDGGG